MKNKYQFLVLALLVQAVFSNCPDGWVKHGGECYHFSRDVEPYFIARIACQVLGGSLVVIEMAQKNTFIANQIQYLPNPAYWMDLNDLQEEGSWVWQKTGNAPEYTQWHPN
ncbi:perlucin-like protein [Mya arenaria]|uniref:perlucin-like protein n=1 Tax=Mya arenaria TaxID=6604 RepID=UPI0022E37408|nr:perlucin-like protein [Mya arenaria]